MYKIRVTSYGFSLVEILIVVAILGILAAIVVPTFKGHTEEAKQAAAKDNLRILRNTIELYATQHNGVPPGYSGDDPSKEIVYYFLILQLVHPGDYLSEFPENPFNSKSGAKMIGNDEDFPAEPVMTDVYGWIYKPATKTIKLNWQGTDSTGVSYFDY